jgi:HEPN domain-containing protein
MPLDVLVNEFAIRSFRDEADGDYIAARFALRSELTSQYLWSSQQAMEKYLKCIILMNRIEHPNKRWHKPSVGLQAIEQSGKLSLGLTAPTRDFLDYLDRYGEVRYFEVSYTASMCDLVKLDRAVWELRRFCTLATEPRMAVLGHHEPVPKVRLERGRLEAILDTRDHPARRSLLWENGFFGGRRRDVVRLPNRFEVKNAPLDMHSHIVEEVSKYVHISKRSKGALR